MPFRVGLTYSPKGDQVTAIEQLVDGLCFGVRDQLSALALQEQKGAPIQRTETLAQVDAAFETLRTTLAELDTIVGPSDSPAQLTKGSLEEITRRLREESEIARRVQARLHQTEPPAEFPAEAKLESE